MHHSSALRQTLHSLSDASLKTSRQLDDTYYSILEKLSALRQTIGSLQDLCTLTKQLHATFDSDTADLTDEIKAQFLGFDNFSAQENLIDELETRIQGGREKAEALAKRLDSARSRVEAREKVEREWETRTNRTCVSSLCAPSMKSKPLPVADNLPM
jgi:CHAD domain-containing protein